MLGAGLFVGITPAASAAGVWLLAGVALAAAVAAGCGLSTSDGVNADFPRIVGILGRAAGVSAIALSFGNYVAPQHPQPAGVGLVVVVTALSSLGLGQSVVFVRIGAGLVLAVLAVFAITCFAIAPSGLPVPPPPGTPGLDNPAGIPVATALMFFGFLGFDRTGGEVSRRTVLLTIGAALVVTLAVTAAALYQLGGPRLALSPAPLRAALGAADGAGLDPLITIAASVTALLAMLGALGGVRPPGRPVITPLTGIVAAVGAVTLSVPVAISAAAGLMFCHYASAAVIGRLRRPAQVREPRS